MKTLGVLLIAGAALLGVVAAGAAPVLRVGPERELKTPRAAAQVAKDGAVVEIDAAVYRGDVAVWPQHNLTLRGVGGRPHLQAAGKAAGGKAIWVITGRNVTVENIEFSGARVSHRNGAGIRFEGVNLTVRDSHFHHNEMGILLGKRPASEVLIEGCEFNDNTVDYRRFKSLGHNIYIGEVRRFTLRNSYVHHASIGHNVKTRARENYILYNRITDESGGASYLLDVAQGSYTYVIGNLFHQSPHNDNNTLVSFAAEGNRSTPDQALYVVHNTFVNDDAEGVFVYNHSTVPALVVNNVMVGPGSPLVGPGEADDNLITEDAGLRDRQAYDYRLSRGAPAIDQGRMPGVAQSGFALQPAFQYRHPLKLEPRPRVGLPDAGAYEYAGD